MASSNAGASTFPKWQIAIALGATGAIGLGYWYLRQQNSLKSKKPTLSGTSKSTLSLDDSQQAAEAEEEHPLVIAQRYKTEGNTCFKKGKYDEAINQYNKAIEACPSDQAYDLATFYQNRAAAYEQLKKWSSVISDCTKALELHSKYEKALYRRAKAYEATKDYESCLDDITAVCLMQSFKNQNALLMADRVLKELGRQHAAEAMKTRAPKLVSKQFIKTYFMSFSEDPVYKFLLDSTQLITEQSPQGFLKAKLAFATEDFDKVIPACTEEIENAEAKYYYEALSLRAAFHLLCGAQSDAQEDLKTIVESKDADPKIKVNCLIKRASLYMQLERTEDCLKDFETASEIGPEISDVYHHRGQVYLLMDKTEEARKDFNKAVELNPDFAIAVVQKCYADYRYALMTQNVDMLMKNMEDFRKATEKFPSCSEAFILFAQVLTERQQFDKAEELYKKATDLDSNNASVYVHRGLLLLQWKGDIEKAVDLMRTAIKIDDKCEFAYETLGTVEVQRGNLVIAVDMFNSAIELARTEMEMTHLFSLRDAAVSQLKITAKLGIGSQLIGGNTQ